MAHENHFVWYELMTTDADAATAFYRDVVGWGAEDSGHPDLQYTLLTVGGTPVSGLMALCAEAGTAGARPGWIGYVGVEDVEAFASRVKEAGGAILRGPIDLPVGRFANVADPQGAPFILFKPSRAEPRETPAHGTPGVTGWHELHATDRDSAYAFYADLFGWTKGDALDVGPMGAYQLYEVGGEAVGGMMTKTDAEPAPFWLYYFIVDEIDAAAARVTDRGGEVLRGPHPVPGGGWILHGRDPQGALFALVGPRKNA